MNTGDWLVQYATELKLGSTLGLLVLLAAAQSRWPKRGDAGWPRWRTNLTLTVVANLTLKLLVPVSMAAAALWAQTHGIGLFNQWDLTPGARGPVFLASLALLDLAIYWQHRLFHVVPWLWRVHRVHHADAGFDVSLGLRFHPLEIVPSALFKLAVVVALGVTPVAAVSYELLLLAMSLFSHTDLALPTRADAILRSVLVTPDFHRVHHSVHRRETDSNYGNWLTLWDRLFRSYIAQPRDGHPGMRIGLEPFHSPRWQTLRQALMLPFVATPKSPDSPTKPPLPPELSDA